jgi:membrane protease YdiL (CAAX protease family)
VTSTPPSGDEAPPEPIAAAPPEPIAAAAAEPIEAAPAEPIEDPALWPAPKTRNRPAVAVDASVNPDANPFEQPAPPPPRTGHDLWRPWTAWTALVTGFGLTIVGGLIVAIVAAALGASVSDPSPGVNIGLTFFQNCALISAALFFAHMAGRPWPKDFGLRSPAAGIDEPLARRAALKRAVGLLLAVWVGFYVVSAIWVAALNLDEHQTLPDELGVGGSALNLVLVVILITIIAPLGEELFFRGYFFGALRNWHGWLPAAIITGAVFGAIHIGSAPIGLTVPLAFFGFGLCFLYQRTGSLYPCIALHALNNSVALGLTQHWSWQILPTMIVAVAASLTIASLLARALENRASAVVPPLPQPAA